MPPAYRRPARKGCMPLPIGCPLLPFVGHTSCTPCMRTTRSVGCHGRICTSSRSSRGTDPEESMACTRADLRSQGSSCSPGGRSAPRRCHHPDCTKRRSSARVEVPPPLRRRPWHGWRTTRGRARSAASRASCPPDHAYQSPTSALQSEQSRRWPAGAPVDVTSYCIREMSTCCACMQLIYRSLP